jgi:hypothetical protein
MKRLCQEATPNAEARLVGLRTRFAEWQIYPRHHDIARVLGIPKGTVDSTLYYVRRTLESGPAHSD